MAAISSLCLRCRMDRVAHPTDPFHFVFPSIMRKLISSPYQASAKAQLALRAQRTRTIRLVFPNFGGYITPFL